MAKFNDFNFAGKKAIVRVDFNVPLNEKGEITDDTRIRGAVPTLKKILADGGALIIMSHMGKPKGKINHKLSLSQITSAVASALERPVKFAQDSADAKSQADALMSDSVQPHRQQPTRLHRPWDSLGKNTGVGCHFLLQCMKVKNESEK